MSLINEALKKAQRQRAETAAGAATHSDGTPVAKRAEPKSAKSTVLIAVGVLVLVVVSIAITAWWITRPISHPTPAIAKATPPPDAAINTVTVAPLVVPPIAPAAGNPKTAAAGNPAQTKPVSAPLASTTPSAPSPGAASELPSTAAAPAVREIATDAAAPQIKPAPATPQPDDRIRRFVDAVRVTGIRSSGADSKVLKNDRVYRVNQVVNPELGVRLTKVSDDSLTFTDRNGVEYVKYL